MEDVFWSTYPTFQREVGKWRKTVPQGIITVVHVHLVKSKEKRTNMSPKEIHNTKLENKQTNKQTHTHKFITSHHITQKEKENNRKTYKNNKSSNNNTYWISYINNNIK